MVEPERKWRYALGEQEIGPISWEELRALATSGAIQRQTLVWRAGLEHWVPAGRIKGLLDDVPMPIKPIPYAHQSEPDQAAMHQARRLALAMFVALVTLATGVAAGMVARQLGARPGATPSLLVVNLGKLAEALAIPAGLGAVAAVIWRWKQLRRLDLTHQVLGLVGCLGLLVLLVLGAFW